MTLTYAHEAEFLSEAAPAFRFDCPGGCTVGGVHRTTAQCRAVLQGDLVLAVRLAGKAAALLEASPRTATVAGLYRHVFAHPPTRPVPWAPDFADSGRLTAHRLRRAAAGLQNIVIHFQCQPQPAGHPASNAAVPHVVNGHTNKNVIQLFPRYWSNTRSIRAGVLIHEVLHLYYLGLIRDQNTATRRRTNAHCYEWLALRLNGITPDPTDLTACRLLPP